MRPQDGSDDAAGESQLDPAQPMGPAEPSVRPDENGHVAGEPAVVDALPLPAELSLRLASMETTLAEMGARFASESDGAGDRPSA